MIKKTISILSALVILSILPMNSYAAEIDDPALYELAYSLGAKTDHLNIVNYRAGNEHPFNVDAYYDYLHRCSLTEATYYPADTFSSAVSSGSCVGITILEILSHNGIISPNDIQENASYLSEIPYNNNTDRVISNYQALQSYIEFSNYEKYLLSSIKYVGQIKALINSAEESMENNKYFFISIRAQKFSHAVCGIGIAKGNWRWNGKEYDKCILTLDSNLSDKDGNAVGFDNKTCIYINSDTHSSCIPAYDLYSDNDSTLSYTSITDETLLNNRGFIKPSASVQTDTSSIKLVSSPKEQGINIYSVSENGEKTLDNREVVFGSWGGDASVLSTDSISIEMNNSESIQNFRFIDTDRWIDIELLDNNSMFRDGVIDISDNQIYIKNMNNSIMNASTQIRMNERTFGFAPYYWWEFDSDVDKDISIEVKENGILLKANGVIDTSIAATKFLLDNNGFYLHDGTHMLTESAGIAIKSRSSVLLCVDNNNDITVYIDNNDDDLYDIPVQRGDINCDGQINASDASQVLSLYSIYSTTHRITKYYALGDINNDDKIDARDASGILSEYARLSTM